MPLSFNEHQFLARRESEWAGVGHAVSFKSAILNLQFLFHRIHLGGNSALALFSAATLDGKIHPIAIRAQFFKSAGHHSHNPVPFSSDAGAHGSQLVWKSAFSDHFHQPRHVWADALALVQGKQKKSMSKLIGSPYEAREHS